MGRQAAQLSWWEDPKWLICDFPSPQGLEKLRFEEENSFVRGSQELLEQLRLNFTGLI
jgi:hypothetical protein